MTRDRHHQSRSGRTAPDQRELSRCEAGAATRSALNPGPSLRRSPTMKSSPSTAIPEKYWQRRTSPGLSSFLPLSLPPPPPPPPPPRTATVKEDASRRSTLSSWIGPGPKADGRRVESSRRPTRLAPEAGCPPRLQASSPVLRIGRKFRQPPPRHRVRGVSGAISASGIATNARVAISGSGIVRPGSGERPSRRRGRCRGRSSAGRFRLYGSRTRPRGRSISRSRSFSSAGGKGTVSR